MKKFLLLVPALAALSITVISRAEEQPAPPATTAPATTDTAVPADIPAAPTTSTPASTDNTAETAARSREAVEAYNTGVDALNKNDLTTAATQFQKAIDLNANDAGALMFLGYVRLRQEQYSDALTALEAAKAQSGRLDAKLTPILYNNLGIAYANLSRPSDALMAYQRAVELSKDEYTDARYNLAFALVGQKRYKEGLPHLVKLRDQRLTDKAFQSSVNDGLAEVYESQGNWALALASYKKVTELNPTDPAARFNYALALSKSGRLDEAISQGDQVLKMRPNHQPTLLLLGDLYSRKGNWEKAKQNLKRYVTGDEQNFTAWFTLGVAFDYTSSFDQALDAYGKAEALSPNDPAVKNNIGRILFKREKYDDATARLKDALKLDPNFDDARINLALVYTAQNKWNDAVAQWKVYLDSIRTQLQKTNISADAKTDLKKKALSARGALAENYLKAGAYANAVTEYRMLLNDAPDNLDAMSNLGLALYHTKAYDEAIKTYRQVIVKDPKNAIAYNNLGVVLEATNKREEAVQNYRKALQLNPNYAEARINVERLTTAT